MEQPKKEICTIRIVFSVESDEQAMEYKKRITTLLSGIPEAQSQFTIMSAPMSLKQPPPM